MKIYNKVVIDIASGRVLEEDSYEYDGPVAECKGGGGASGAVDFPPYLKARHMQWLEMDDGGAGVTIEPGTGVASLIKAGIATSPYAGEVAYNPDTNILAMFNALDELKNWIFGVVDEMGQSNTDPLALWTKFLTAGKDGLDQLYSDDAVDAAVAAYSAQLEDKLTTDTLPKYQVGMRDINAVVSSTYVIGEAVLRGFNERDVNKYHADLHLQQYSQKNQMLLNAVGTIAGFRNGNIGYADSLVKATIEAYRMATVFKKEQLAEQLDIDTKDYTWALSLYQQGGNVMSAISGASVNNHPAPSTAQSVLGGALSGAAAGAQVSGNSGMGIAIGAIGGALMGAM